MGLQGADHLGLGAGGPLPAPVPTQGGSQGGGRLGPTPVNVLVNDPAEDGTSANKTQSETSLVLGANDAVIAAYNDSFYANSNPQQYTGYFTWPPATLCAFQVVDLSD